MRNNRIGLAILMVMGLLGTHGHVDADQPSGPRAQGVDPIVLAQLTSPDEAMRFKALETARLQIRHLQTEDLSRVLGDTRDRNVSSLIFLLMEEKNDLLYRLSPPLLNALTEEKGAFPNIAYYYARVLPQKGLTALSDLYEHHPEHRLAICKAIGHVGTPEAVTFLFSAAKAAKGHGKELFNVLAGLQQSRQVLPDEVLEWFLNQRLDREALIALSENEVSLSDKDLETLYAADGQKRFFAVESIFRRPAKHIEALKYIVETELGKKHYDYVRQLMMADRMRNTLDPALKTYRQTILDRIQFLSTPRRGKPEVANTTRP
jgi:hypothetical protein